MWGSAKTALAIIGFLALFGFFAFQTGVASKYPQRHGEQHATTESNEQKNIFERFWDWTTDDPVAFFTFVLSVSTIGLWIVTWRSGVRQSLEMRASIAVAQRSADAAQTQAAILAAVEGPMPLVHQIKLAEYAKIPGEIIVSDELPPGSIRKQRSNCSQNCRALH